MTEAGKKLDLNLYLLCCSYKPVQMPIYKIIYDIYIYTPLWTGSLVRTSLIQVKNVYRANIPACLIKWLSQRGSIFQVMTYGCSEQVLHYKLFASRSH